MHAKRTRIIINILTKVNSAKYIGVTIDHKLN